MAETTKIEWADSTWNPWIGCMKVSPACDHCYAEDMMDTRYGRVQWGGPGKGAGTRARTSAAYWRKPLQWQKQAPQFYDQHGRHRRVFCASLADVFDNEVPVQWRVDLWNLIRETPHLIWMLLTKRPQNIEGMLPRFWDEISNSVWLGTTAEDQARADRNIPHLLKHDCAVRFVSCEPLLGPIDLWPWLNEAHRLDWIIAGGESGPNARPSHPDWFRSMRDQAADDGVPFFFKQWGEWVGDNGPLECGDDAILDGPVRCAWYDGDTWHYFKHLFDTPENHSFVGEPVYRLGKHRAGRLLDGVTHDEFPK